MKKEWKPTMVSERAMNTLLMFENLDGETLTPFLRSSESSFAYTTHIINEFERRGLITTEKQGRVRRLRLTPKGNKAIEALKNLLKLLKEG